jgi:penicillin-binding protein 1A
LVLTVGVPLGIAWVLTPGVGDAQQRVSAELATNGGTPLQGDVPEDLALALIATEDTRFEHHIGIDPIGAVRATWGALTGTDQGGSTLDQQLAKNLYADGRQGFTDRIQSVVLALKFDAGWSKDDLLRMYLDDGFYGHGFYGHGIYGHPGLLRHRAGRPDLGAGHPARRPVPGAHLLRRIPAPRPCKAPVVVYGHRSWCVW